MLLALAAPAWAQDGKEPTTQAGEARVSGDAVVVGGQSGADNCAIRSVGGDGEDVNVTCEESSGGDATSGGSNGGDDFEDDGAMPSGSVDSGNGPVAPEAEAGSSLPLVIGSATQLAAAIVLSLGVARLRR
ncbi:MAG: hypothetical protein M3088_05565 [Actinomycetota bacterium]|nr:hypothetical protein [Actinomycetota bacterium]